MTSPRSAGAAWAAGAAGAVPASGTWHSATEVLGIAALNVGGDAQIESVSCSSQGNCGAGGFYTDGSGVQQAFVVNEVAGTWHTAHEVPGTAALNVGPAGAMVNSVSCRSAGNCSAGGFYSDSSGGFQAFAVSEVSGTWGTAAEVPGTDTLNAGADAWVNSVACGSAGNCVAGGTYTDSAGNQQAFVDSQVSGTWRTAVELPGTATLNVGGSAQVSSVSCPSPGNCAAGGYFTNSSDRGQAFVASRVNGVWGRAKEALNTGTLNKGGDASVTSISCPSAGNCTAGGYYTDGSGGQQVFAFNQVSGTWQEAREIPGTGTLNKRGVALLLSVSCHAAGNCATGGSYVDGLGQRQAFIASRVKDAWHTAEEVPGTARLNKPRGDAQTMAVSCGAPGNCAAVGYYSDLNHNLQVFVVNEVNGSWRIAEEAPGTGRLNKGGLAIANSVSCPAAGVCGVGGGYTTSSGAMEAFVTSES
jgi:hypothetical protein